jgi:murein L,D-transpeptidase YcbB/YkuD
MLKILKKSKSLKLTLKKVQANSIVFLFIFVFLNPSCKTGDGSTLVTQDSLKKRAQADWNNSIAGNFSEESTTVFDSLDIEKFTQQYPALAEYKEHISTFYRNRNMSYAWFKKNELIEQAGNLADRVMNLQEEGINKGVPYYRALDSLMYNSTNQPITVERKIQVELMLTAQYFAFAAIALEGKDVSISKATNWYLPRKKVSYEDYLDSLLIAKANDDGDLKIPVYRQYELLRKYLIKYQKLEQSDTWFSIKANKTFRLGDSSITIKQVRKRLFDLGDFNGDTISKFYDIQLENAVKQFQMRHGFQHDGLLGKTSFNELNIRFKTRVKQILVNMERSRWLPVRLNNDYLVVNIPEFKLHVYSGDSLQWSCSVVVGKAIHKTVVFSGDLKYVVFRPYWNVPRSIVVNEILPDMRKNSNYIARNNMEITGYLNGIPTIRQKPGPANSLGLVKFVFPNSYNIYLHDTPAKSLFGETSRAFSHGCIRISEPGRLANFLLRNHTDWNSEKINSAMSTGSEQYVTLQDKIPVFIAYFTAFVDRKGKINFRKDIYDRDDRLASMIME